MMAIIMIVHHIRVRSWIYYNKPLIKPPTPHPHQLDPSTRKQKNTPDYNPPPPKYIEMNSIYYNLLTLS